jgi:hypothetical protein
MATQVGIERGTTVCSYFTNFLLTLTYGLNRGNHHGFTRTFVHTPLSIVSTCRYMLVRRK